MRWPWSKNETRQDTDYGDAVVRAILAAASGDVISGLSAGKEIAAGWWQRAFASAEIRPQGVVADLLTPHLGYIGRSLVEHGEAVFEIAVDGGLELRPAATVTVEGSNNPRGWTYLLSFSGPSEQVTRTLPADRVLHLVYARSATTPWRGIGPIDASGTTRKLLDNLEQRLGQEAGEAVGHLIPVPNVQSSGTLQADIRALKGQAVLVESTSQGWGQGPLSAPHGDFQLRRVGANPPESLRHLRRDVELSVLAACGVNPAVLGGTEAAGSREGYRQFLHGTIAPVALDLARSIASAFDVPGLSFNFDRLMASDLSGRARAFQSMVGGGMDTTKAAALAGLMEPE